MRNKFILLVGIGVLGQSVMALASGGKMGQGEKTRLGKKAGRDAKNEQDALVLEANKKLAAAQRKVKERTERKALNAKVRKLGIL